MPFSGKGNFKVLLLLSACFRTYVLPVLLKEAELARNSVFRFSLFVSSLWSRIPPMLSGSAFCRLG